MLKNYLILALRNLSKHPGYTALNVVGLAVGIACCLLIVLYVQNELSYDRFHANADRVYRIAVDSKYPDSPTNRYARSSRPIASVLRANYPDVERVVRLLGRSMPGIKHEGRWYFDDTKYFAEPSFFDVFSFPLVKGDPATALDEPYSAVLTERAARKYFGTEAALGQTLALADTLAFTVTGIAADPPHHSHLPFDILLSWSTFEQLSTPYDWEWTNFWTYTYVLLREGASAAAFEQKIADLVMHSPVGDRLRQMGSDVTLVLEPLLDIYLRSDRTMQAGPTGDIRYVYLFSAIALFILLLACINFINLATARSAERAKEVGVRKVMGSSRAALIRQFLTEAVLIVACALVVALAVISLVLPLFNQLAEKELTLGILQTPVAVMGLLGLVLLVGLLAGSYPAFVLSRFRPVAVLKGAFRTSRRGLRLRQALVVFQFAVSVALIVGSLVVYAQLHYMQNRKLGFEKEQVIVVEAGALSQDQPQQYQTIKQAFRQHPAVQQVAASSRVPGHGGGGGTMHPEGLPEGESRHMSYFAVDHDFIDLMRIEMVAGRDFAESFETDVRGAALINETAVTNFGWGAPDEAVGKTIRAGWNGQPLTVVGVFNDYHQASLREPIQPLLLLIDPNWFSNVSVRIATDNVQEVVAHLEQTWQRLFPEHSFSYFFLDEHYDAQYQAERRFGLIMSLFTTLAILVACLGLFGLASLVTAQRTKEVGIRKVLGASVASIVLLLSQDVVKLVFAAIAVAAPLAYVAMNRWLEDFAYRIQLSGEIFLVAGLAALLVAILTVSYQAIRTARANPVKSLRYE